VELAQRIPAEDSCGPRSLSRVPLAVPLAGSARAPVREGFVAANTGRGVLTRASFRVPQRRAQRGGEREPDWPPGITEATPQQRSRFARPAREKARVAGRFARNSRAVSTAGMAEAQFGAH